MKKPKDIGYYLHLLKLKKYFLIIPAIIITMLSLIIAVILPSVYESTSTILIEEQQIPQDFVRTTVTGFADQRIQSITQQILSRTKLWELIKQFDLYKENREKYTQEEVIETMRNNIMINTISADMMQKGGKGKQGDSLTIAFTISYKGQNPATVQKVNGNLASLYLEQNLKDRQEKAETTTKFLEAELKELEERISSIGAKITKFKQLHEGALPELQAHNRSQAERLENDIKQLEVQISALQDRRAYLESQIATINPDLPIAGQEPVMDPRARLYMLQVTLSTLSAKVSQDHPDVKKIKREIAELEKLVSTTGGRDAVARQKLRHLRTELAAKQGRLSPEHPEIKKLQAEIARLEQNPDSSGTTGVPQVANPNNPAFIGMRSQIQGIDNQISMFRRQQAEMASKMQMYRQRLEETPKIEQEYAALARDYQNAHAKHMEVMNKLLTSRIAEGMEEHQKAEKFTLIDPASYPEKPVSPNRPAIALAGLLFGLASGVGLILLSDQLDHSVKDAADIGWITDLPVLGTISRIQTLEQTDYVKKRRRMIAAATCSSILLFLILVHFFYKDLWLIMARFMQIFNKYT